jgi:lipopolysaccharide biosynthesis regulator YciM
VAADLRVSAPSLPERLEAEADRFERVYADMPPTSLAALLREAAEALRLRDRDTRCTNCEGGDSRTAHWTCPVCDGTGIDRAAS